MTAERIDQIHEQAYEFLGNPNDNIIIKRSELKHILGHIKFAEKRYLVKMTRFRRANADDFNLGTLTYDQRDETHLEFARKDRVIIYSSNGLLVMQSGFGEAGLFPGSKVTKWIDTEVVDIFNG